MYFTFVYFALKIKCKICALQHFTLILLYNSVNETKVIYKSAFFYRHAAPLATKPGKALGSKTTLLAYGAFRAARKIAFPPVMSMFHC